MAEARAGACALIGLYGGAAGVRGSTTRLLITYNGLSLNNPADTLVAQTTGPNTYEIDTVAGSTAMDYLSEVNQQRDGLEVYPFRKVNRIVTLRGIIRAPSVAQLHDKIKALANAFDPAKIGHENSDPFLALDFSVPTTDLANYPTGYAASRYYALPMRVPDPVIDYAVGLTASFDIVMLMRDPRRYLQTAVTKTGSGTISNSKADYRSWPTLTITMAGAGNAAYAYTNNPALAGIATSTLTLDLSGCVNNDVVVVDMERRTITKNGASAMSMYVSGNYFEIEPGDNVISIANTANATSVLSFEPAFSI